MTEILKNDYPMTKRFFEIYNKEGSIAAEKWFSKLSDEERRQYISEIGHQAGTTAAAIEDFCNAAYGVRDAMFLAAKELFRIKKKGM